MLFFQTNKNQAKMRQESSYNFKVIDLEVISNVILNLYEMIQQEPFW